MYLPVQKDHETHNFRKRETKKFYLLELGDGWAAAILNSKKNFTFFGQKHLPLVLGAQQMQPH